MRFSSTGAIGSRREGGVSIFGDCALVTGFQEKARIPKIENLPASPDLFLSDTSTCGQARTPIGGCPDIVRLEGRIKTEMSGYCPAMLACPLARPIALRGE